MNFASNIMIIGFLNLIMLGIGGYVLYLVIKALRIYIKKNS
jgi:hypothetical protein